MSKRFTKLFTNIYFILGMILILTFILNINEFLYFLKLEFISGGDGPSFINIGEYYVKHIFPSTFGWIPNWFGGMPFPQFYPPLFFFFVALLSKIFFFSSYAVIYKCFVVFLEILVPSLLTWLTYNTTKNLYATLTAGVLSLIAISNERLMDGLYGISIASTLNAGFGAQLLGFILLVLWINYFLQIEDSIKSRYLAGIFLLGVFLSNAHIVPITGIYFLTTFFVKTVKYFKPLNIKGVFSNLILYFFSGAFPLLLASFWYLPLLKNYSYFVTMALPITSNQIRDNLWYLIVISFAVTFLSLKVKQKSLLIISLSNLAFIIPAFFELDKKFPNLPLQPGRWMAPFFFLSIVVLSYLAYLLLNFAFSKFQKKYVIYFWSILLILLLISNTISNIRNFESIPGPKRANTQNHVEVRFLEDAMNYTKKLTGRINIENYFGADSFSGFTLDGYIGLHSKGVNTISLRESSINSLFMVPIRNTLSLNPESYGIRSFLAKNKLFINQDIDAIIERAKNSGTNHFFVKTPFMQYKFNKSDKVFLEKDFDSWKLYSLKEPALLAEIPKYEPVLLYSRLDFKNRKPNYYNYTLFQEQLFFDKDRKFVLASPHDLNLDTTLDLDKFSIAVISDYKYRNIDAAFDKLEKYSKENTLIIIYDKDPLFNKLSRLDSTHKIIIAPRNININEPNIIISQQNLNILLDKIDQIVKPTLISKDTEVKDIDISGKEIEVKMNNLSNKLVPIIVKETYFPSWKRMDGENVYLVTPTFMLTFAKQDFRLKFETDKSVYIGQIVSLITLLLCFGLLWRDRKKLR